jgi:Xaa-Pro aminopeptidase
VVVEGPAVEGAEKPLNAFETLTLAPIDRRLIVPSMLTAEEASWVEVYHAKVAEALLPSADEDTRPWLEAATAPLAQD